MVWRTEHRFAQVHLAGSWVKAGEVSVIEGLEDLTRVCEFTLVDMPSSVPAANDPVILRLVWHSAMDQQYVFAGYLDTRSVDDFPYSARLVANGELSKLRRLRPAGKLDLTNRQDGPAIRDLLDAAGVPYYAGDIRNIGWKLGHTKKVVLKAQQPIEEMVSEIDRVFGCKTLETGNSRISRIAYDLAPSATMIQKTYVKGEANVLFAATRALGSKDEILNVNRVEGLSFKCGECDCRIWGKGVANHPLLGSGRRAPTSTFSSDLIQDNRLARLIARRLMRWHNRVPEELTLQILDDPDIHPTSVIGYRDSTYGQVGPTVRPFTVTRVDRRFPIMTVIAVGGAPGTEGSITAGVDRKCNRTRGPGTEVDPPPDAPDGLPPLEPFDPDGPGVPPPILPPYSDPPLDPIDPYPGPNLPPVDPIEPWEPPGGLEPPGPGIPPLDPIDDLGGGLDPTLPPVGPPEEPIEEPEEPPNEEDEVVCGEEAETLSVTNSGWREVAGDWVGTLGESGEPFAEWYHFGTGTGVIALNPTAGPEPKTEANDTIVAGPNMATLAGEAKFLHLDGFFIAGQTFGAAGGVVPGNAVNVQAEGHNVGGDIFGWAARTETEGPIKIGDGPRNETNSGLERNNGGYGGAVPDLDEWIPFVVEMDWASEFMRTTVTWGGGTLYMENERVTGGGTPVPQEPCEHDEHRLVIHASGQIGGEPSVMFRKLTASWDCGPNPNYKGEYASLWERAMMDAGAVIKQGPGGERSHMHQDSYDIQTHGNPTLYPLVAGTVVEIDWQTPGGHVVRIQTEYGLITYGHLLEAPPVAIGQQVTTDTPIGAVDSSFGSEPGPGVWVAPPDWQHLHIGLSEPTTPATMEDILRERAPALMEQPTEPWTDDELGLEGELFLL